MNSAAIQASHLSKSFGAKQVINDLTFEVSPGDVIGVLGKNGAGKTTLLELMLGFTPPTGGAVSVFGHESQRLPGSVKSRVGFVPQQDELLDQVSVADQLRIIASFYARWDVDLIDRLCGEWGMNPKARIKTLSVGERQKLSILLAFGHCPDLLVLDEPVASLDPLARRQFLEQLVETSVDGSRSVVFSSHIVSDIERLANRIWILKDGRLDWQGDLDSLKESIVRLHIRGAMRSARGAADSWRVVGTSRRRVRVRRGARLDARYATVASGAARRHGGGGVARPGRDLPGAASMKAIARLVYSFFMSTPLTRALSIGGLALCAISLLVLTSLPQSEHMLSFAWAGQMAFFLGSALMPSMVGRLSQGHASHLLPYGRVKLLVSAMVTVAIVALPAGLLTPFAYVAGVSGKISDLTSNPKLLDFTIDLGLVIYTSFCILAGWLYLAMWFFTRQRNAAGFAKGLLVIVILIIAPSRQLSEPNADIILNLQQLAVAWAVFGAGFLAWPRLKVIVSRWRPAGFMSSQAASVGLSSGKQVDLILGTSNPWLFIAAQALPILILTRTGMSSAAIWLYFLTIFSTVTGAISGQAAERSRALWLRGGWSRTELFSEVERSFGRHNCFVLGVLLVMMVGIGSYANYPTTLLAAGLPLLILGTVLSTYLGLMLTRGLRWPEAAIGIAIMVTLMAVPLQLDSQDTNLIAVIAIEALLAVVAFILRAIARRRWAQIDWTQCRPARLATARSA